MREGGCLQTKSRSADSNPRARPGSVASEPCGGEKKGEAPSSLSSLLPPPPTDSFHTLKNERMWSAQPAPVGSSLSTGPPLSPGVLVRTIRNARSRRHLI